MRALRSSLRLCAEMADAVSQLSAPVKIAIAVAMAAEVALIIGWHPGKTGAPAPSPILATPAHEAPKVDQKVPDRVQAPVPDPNRLITLENPEVSPDGSIRGAGPPFFLAEIGPFTSKDVCTRSSGERWACGLHAYATLRNSIAHKTIQCTPPVGSDADLMASCRLDGLNLSMLLVRDGLARVREGIEDRQLLRAQAEAKLKHVGIWDR